MDRYVTSHLRHADALLRLRALAECHSRLETDLHGVLARVMERQEQLADWKWQQAERLERSELLLSALAARHMAHAERLERSDAIIARLDADSTRHATRLARLETLLQAITTLLDRPTGRPE